MSDYPTTSVSLLARVRDHADHRSWSEFVTLYRPTIYRFGRQRGLQEADAQDLAQSVLVAIADKIGDWKHDPQRARFRTWLSRVAQNQAVTMYRRRCADAAHGGTSMMVTLQAQADLSDESAEIQDQYRREVFRHAARQVRQEFEETTWQAFWLTAVEQLSVAEAAESLGRTNGSIYTARSRVIRRLQEVVQKIEQEDETLSSTALS